jgi:ligand-binding SRPBCC domain-containing protein
VKIYEFTDEVWLPRPRSEIFDFFADARNLQEITPDWLHFTVLSEGPMSMRAGALIDYKLRLRGFPLKWRTEIRTWEPPLRFVDVQQRGPYQLWEHEHTFEEESGGTKVRDRVRYAVFMGWLVVPLFVNRDVHRIFDFRKRRLIERFAVAA